MKLPYEILGKKDVLTYVVLLTVFIQNQKAQNTAQY